MTETKFPDLPTEDLLQRLNISKVSGNKSHYNTYTVNLGESTFTIRKKNDLMWVDSGIVEQHGDDMLDYIGCYIDNNSI
ncbi:hypothetical protein F0919_15205 [Taibaiella lutea]|uniref:Uncharacterized protein n=1 Tax=Taibaiella lutea TaxID=2608001 RepID=A0A5M6CAF0_9BACT|nr:hypothetical protein [Taibaiella lutea]KAA5532146.1 hypothetical protein F0919_15205 [Taibaiella lutea]